MLNVKTKLTSWLAKMYLARVGRRGFDLGKLPDETLTPLKRHGLDPVPALGQMRREAPVQRLKIPFGISAWLVTGYDEARAVLGDKVNFSNDFGNLVGSAPGATVEQNPGGLGFADPPHHTRLRKLLQPEFTMRRLKRLTPGIAAIVEQQLDAMEEAGRDGAPVDLVEHFALPIPSLVICELLGVDYGRRDDFQRLSMQRFDLFDGATASFGAISESLEFLLGVVREQRENPGDGLLGMIIREHGDEVDDRELAGLADGVLTGGFETTASMLALGTLVALGDTDARKVVQHGDADDPAVHAFVEELLRYLTVVQVAFPRFAREDVTIGDAKIERGDGVIVSLSGADRAESLGSELERFDPRREPTPHLAFGYGAHRCIGAELARMELRAAFPALLQRFPDMRLATKPEELAFRQASIVYGVDALPAVLHP